MPTIDSWERCLYKLSLVQLDALLEAHDEWFTTSRELPDEFKVARAAILSGVRGPAIQLIMGTDPIMVDGGLFDFLYQNYPYQFGGWWDSEAGKWRP